MLKTPHHYVNLQCSLCPTLFLRLIVTALGAHSRRARQPWFFVKWSLQPPQTESQHGMHPGAGKCTFGRPIGAVPMYS